MADPELVTRTTPSKGVVLLRLNRPAKLNSLNLAMKEAIVAQIREAEAREDVHAIVLTGSDKAFAAGSDVAEMMDMGSRDHARLDSGRVFEMVRACSKIVIAAVEGYALGGGCELALACDLVIAGEGARFGQPEINVGIMPGAGGSQHFLRAFGPHRALMLLLTGERVTAEEALRCGLISHMCPAGQAVDEALGIAAMLAQRPPLAVAAIRRVLAAGMAMGRADALRFERAEFVALFDSDDQHEGMAAFVEGRTPRYSGR